MAEVNMSFGGQASDSSSSRGLNWYERNHFSGLAPAEFGYLQSRARAAADDPGGLSYMNTVNALLPTGEFGLHPSSTMGVRQLGSESWNKASGSRAQRGFRAPTNLEAVLGDSMRMIAPQLIPLQTQYALGRAELAPKLRGLSMGYAATPMQIISSLLSGTGASTSSGMGFGLGLSGVDVGGMSASAASASGD
jgi:hypothetical protein